MKRGDNNKIIISSIQALVDWWPTIDEVITETLLDMGEDVDTSAPCLQHPFAGSLGCGAFGCVYPTRTPHKRWVVKISLDPFEGPLTNLCIQDPKLQKHKGVAYMTNVWRLPVTHPADVMIKNRIHRMEYKIWVILREDIDPADDVWKGTQKLLSDARTDAEILNLFAEDGAEDHELDPLIHEYLKQLDQAALNPKAEQVVDFVKLYLEQTGIALADVHSGNIGYRIHNLAKFGGHRHAENTLSDYYACFDIGASKMEPGIAPVDLLQNPGIPVLG